VVVDGYGRMGGCLVVYGWLFGRCRVHGGHTTDALCPAHPSLICKAWLLWWFPWGGSEHLAYNPVLSGSFYPPASSAPNPVLICPLLPSSPLLELQCARGCE
jgi:hypothetical protein